MTPKKKAFVVPPRLQVGYPQSGNTWTCWLLAGLLGHVPETWAHCTELIPNWADVASGKKTAPLGWVRGHSKLPPEHVEIIEAALYIVRHPFDVMLSSYRYRCQYQGCTARPEAYFEEFISNGGEAANLVMETGTWSENVESWLTFPRVSLLRYEDLIANPYNTLRSISYVADSIIVCAVAGATHERMKSLDTQLFVGPGKANRWKGILSEEGRRRGFEAFGETMSKVGYETS